MKALRIFLLVLIIVGLGLLASEKWWVPKLADFIVEKEQTSQVLVEHTVSDSIAPVDIKLGVGDKATVDDFAITFNSLVQDYRCPADAECMEGGAVTANVTFAQGSHVETKNMSSDEVPQRFGEYQTSIEAVAPALESKKEIPPNAYRITFRVSK